MEQQLQTIYDDGGRPGAEAFRFQARRQGLNITLKEAQDFVKKPKYWASFPRQN